MEIKNILSGLSGHACISGSEDSVARTVMALYAPFADEVWTDALGSVIAVKRCGRPDAVKLMLDAHMDEIGLMVTDIDEKGFLRFCKIGGVDERVLPACEVVVHGKRDLHGIISVKPPHIQTEDDMKQSLKMDELAIDVGYDAQKVRELVSVGDSVTFFRQPSELAGGQMCGKSFDDRAGITALLYAAEKLAQTKLDIDVYFVSSVQEETGLAGATTAAYAIAPDYALVIDVTHGITPDNSERAFEVGAGPSVSVGPNVSGELYRLLCELGKQKNIDLHPEVDGGSTGTNAWAAQVSRTGVATAGMSVPLKYMHTPVETLSADDVKAAGEMAAAFVCALSKARGA